MKNELVFTQNLKSADERRRQLFLSVGLFPLMVFAFFLTWFNLSGFQYFDFGPEKFLFLAPVVVAMQIIVLLTKSQTLRWSHIKLSTEAIELVGGETSVKHLLKDLEKIQVRRDAEKQVIRLSLKFHRLSLTLENYMEMETLRDTIVKYRHPYGKFRLMDTVSR